MRKWFVFFLLAASLILPATPTLATGKPAAAVAATRVNINTAGAPQLATLPGIGKATAEQIVQHREEHGRFSTTEELVKVKGVGPKTLEKLRALVTVE